MIDNWNSPNLNEIFPAGRRKHTEGGRTKEQVMNKWNKVHVNWNRSTKKIAFIGDSYCADFNYNNIKKDKEHRYHAWPELVAKYFNAEILQMGFGGLGFVSSFYTAFVRHPGAGGRSIIEQADIIIACVSSPDRLPSRHGFPYGPALANARNFKELTKTLNMPMKYLETGKAYYENIFLGNFHYIAQKGAIRELDDIVEDQSIVWLPCFDESMCDYEPKNGVIGDAPLFDLFVRDAQKLNPSISQQEMLAFAYKEHSTISNHMGKEANEKLANHIINYIDNKKEFDLLPQHGASKYTIPIKDIINDNSN